MSKGPWVLLPLLGAALFSSVTHAQIDPEERRLIQLGYNQPIEGRGPIAGYGFYYYNQPAFLRTNLTLRLSVAPIYLDTELGFSRLLGPNTDVAVGLSGGGFADSYSEVRRGVFREEESFTGHGGGMSVSLFHRFNPDSIIPGWFVVKATGHHTVFERDSDTHPDFMLPSDITLFRLRSGIRMGGQEPTMTAPLATELSIWHEAEFRANHGPYGYAGDRRVESDSHLFWARALGKYTFGEMEQSAALSLTAGASVEADRFSAYRLGGLLPFASEFPLNLPGYYFQELSAKRFLLLNGSYAFPLDAGRRWSLTAFGGTGWIDYLNGLEQPGDWHSGLGGGITFTSPRTSWFVTLVYSHGFDAIRSHGRGANQIGILFQYDFEARRHGRARPFDPAVSPYRSRGGEKLFR
jgi:hypothetical protein